jgi:hypothetical protein
VRRAKLYYLREKVGKRAKIRERREPVGKASSGTQAAVSESVTEVPVLAEAPPKRRLGRGRGEKD